MQLYVWEAKEKQTLFDFAGFELGPFAQTAIEPKQELFFYQLFPIILFDTVFDNFISNNNINSSNKNNSNKNNNNNSNGNSNYNEATPHRVQAITQPREGGSNEFFRIGLKKNPTTFRENSVRDFPVKFTNTQIYSKVV